MSNGIWGHSSGDAQRHIIFASPLEPWAVEQYLHAWGIGHKRVNGVYKGTAEDAWVVNADYFRKLVIGGILRDEESVLVLSTFDSRDRRDAELWFLRGPGELSMTDSIVCSVEKLGKFGSVTEAEAKSQESYTFDPETGTYYLAKKDWPLVGTRSEPAQHPAWVMNAI